MRKLIFGEATSNYRVVIMGLWFRIESRNGKVICSSEQYSRKAGALKAGKKVALDAGWPLYEVE